MRIHSWETATVTWCISLTFFASKTISVRASIFRFPPELDKLISDPEVNAKDFVGDDNLEIHFLRRIKFHIFCTNTRQTDIFLTVNRLFDLLQSK